MVEQAKELLNRIFDDLEREAGINRVPVMLIQYFAVTNTGAKIPKSALKQARKELGIETYRVGGTQYWERRKEHENANSQ